MRRGRGFRRDRQLEVVRGERGLERLSDEQVAVVGNHLAGERGVPAAGHHQTGLCIVQKLFHPCGRKRRIDREVDLARLENGEDRRDPQRAFLDQQRHGLLPLAPPLNDGPRQPVGRGVERCIGQSVIQGLQREPIRRAADLLLEPLRE